jgi:two-component system, cell cycle response regulator
VLILLDLNGFKGYNDTFGHLAGDALLQRLGGALQTTLAGTARAYRLGGDEFCVLAPATSADIESPARHALSEQGEGFAIAAASGSVRIPAEAGTATDALRLADQRMYAAKLGGRPGTERQTTDALVRVLAERHPALGDHVDGVAELAEAVARRLGLDDRQSAQVRHAAELHDIGKVAVPDAIVHKPGPLSSDEWAFMRTHTVLGERILAAAPALRKEAALVRSSHERWDGQGYPDQRAGEDIPLGSRIIFVCDALDAMTSPRVYRRRSSQEEAVTELRRCAGTQFDPAVVDALCAALRRPLTQAA